jgi:hypothetical protein
MELIKGIMNNKGATIKDNRIVNYKSGYQIAVDSEEKIFYNLATLLYHAKKNGLKNLGIWCYGGLWYVDTNSIRVSRKSEALQLAKEHNQIAIWDWKKQKSIYA